MSLSVTDRQGGRPCFAQWETDRVLVLAGVEEQPQLRFASDALSRALVVPAEAEEEAWTARVPNFLLQFAGPLFLSVVTQNEEGEGREIFKAVYGVAPRMKPQDYTYTENIGYVNWVERSAEAQAFLDGFTDYAAQTEARAARAEAAQRAAETAGSAAQSARSAAEGFKNAAASSAAATAGSAGDAEAWAVGKRNGTDVGSTDPAFHNSSKYYAAAAQASAASVSAAAAQIARNAEDIADLDFSLGGLGETVTLNHGPRLETLEAKADAVAPEFSIDEYYTAGDAVFRAPDGSTQAALYRFTEDHHGAWTGEDVAALDPLALTALMLAQELEAEAQNRAEADAVLSARLLAAFPTDTAQGEIAAFPDGADGLPLKALTVAILPIQSGDGEASPDNIRPITGRTGCRIMQTDETAPGSGASAQRAFEISWEDEAGTVYGGTLDVLAGTLTILWWCKVFDGTETLTVQPSNGKYQWQTGLTNAIDPSKRSSLISSHYKYGSTGITVSSSGQSVFFPTDGFSGIDEWKAWASEQAVSGTPLQVAYVRNNPIVVHLDPVSVTSLQGQNRIFADAGDISATYRADATLYIDKKLAQLQALVLENNG